MNFTPHTKKDIQDMLNAIGVSSVKELFTDISDELRSESFSIDKSKNEFEVFEHMNRLSGKNDTDTVSFVGGGFYDHYIPSIVDALSSRSEFYTSYTPYQPECSQGTLQVLYEYQTAICNITGMDAANASVYDGGTALAEAILMALRITKRNKILIDGCINPLYKNIIKTYLSGTSCSIIEIEHDEYALNTGKIEKEFDSDTASFVFQNPNFFGTINDYNTVSDMAHSNGSLVISSNYPISLGMIKTPYDMGCDISTGDGQSLGNPLNFGGPYLGFIAVKKEYVRNLPGRIAGQTLDKEGNKCFVLTLQAREQHIKRHKATSNICTNQNLCALRSLIYLSYLGKHGFKKLANTIYEKTCYAIRVLSDIRGVNIKNKLPVFNEFVVDFGRDSVKVFESMLEKGFLTGLPLGTFYTELKNEILISITEKISICHIDKFAQHLDHALNKEI
ncbi:aminomethyl-transferring glycine dehydrogenase subunit GcvPA [Elusimicrobiota bacterium]